MNTFHRLLLGMPRSQTIKYLSNSYHLSHSLASNTIAFDTQLHEQPPPKPPPSLYSTQDAAIAIATKLSNCTNLHEVNQIYAFIIRSRMLDFYSAPFHWNNIIRSYTRVDAPEKALQVYMSMSKAGILPDCYTLPITLKAACQFFVIEIGRPLHCTTIKLGLGSNEYCESGFISLYCKYGEFKNAYKLFEENPDRKLGSWNAIIAGLCQSGRPREAIKMFIEMRKCGFQPDYVTMVSVASACGSLGDLKLALQLHNHVFHAKNSTKPDILMLNSLIDMYGKCGRMDLAHRVFSRMSQKNVSSWTSMIVGYAMQGHINKAIEYFHSMREAQVRPNHVTFVAVLSACVHGGKVQEGKHFFEMMRQVYGIMPKLQHYGCMVDLLGRAGLLEEAKEMAEGMPMKANVVIWGCLLGACEKHRNVKIGEWVAKCLQELEPWNDGVYVVLSNIYASNGLWQEVERIRVVMKQQKLAKVPAYSLATGQT